MRRIGNYVIERQLEEGGMGRVFLARHHNKAFPKQYAIKFILHKRRFNKQDAMQRFESEATLLAKIKHPNIVQAFEFSSDLIRGPYIVMELLDGERLDKRIVRKLLSEEEAIEISCMVLDALEAVHSNGWVHRDVKPSNIQISGDGRAVLMDFGVAKSESLTKGPAIVGTAEYASPQQNSGVAVDARADIYSMGVVMFQMLAGHRPFNGDNDHHRVRKAQENNAVPDVANASPGMQAIIHKALSVEPDDRYSTCAEMRNALRALEPQIQAAPTFSVLPAEPVAETRVEDEPVTHVPVEAPRVVEELPTQPPIPTRAAATDDNTGDFRRYDLPISTAGQRALDQRRSTYILAVTISAAVLLILLLAFVFRNLVA